MTPAAERRFASLIGALTADAAAMGLHWLYDAARIPEVSGGRPEFQEPRAENYHQGGGYFAHPQLEAGDNSQYGESLLAFVRGINAAGGRLEVRQLQQSFRDAFGPGGRWHGYIDHPTRITLANLLAGENAGREAEAKLLGETSLAPGRQHEVQRIVAPLAKVKSGQALLDAVRAEADAELLDVALAVAKARDEALPLASGAQDEQLPALPSVVATVACDPTAPDLLERVERSLRVTHDDERALVWARFLASALSAALTGAALPDAIEAGLAGEDSVRARVEEALALEEQDPAELAGKLGRACYLRDGLPIVCALASRASSWREAARWNVLAGGDSCGRAIPLGALLGATWGIGGERGLPYDWLARVRNLADKVDACLQLAS